MSRNGVVGAGGRGEVMMHEVREERGAGARPCPLQTTEAVCTLL